MIRVEIADQQRAFRLNRRRLKQAVALVLRAEGIDGAEISIALVDDDAIARVNETYLHHAGPTDVITFRYSLPRERPLSGEIVVSVETAVREAARRGHAPEAEAMLYLVHGLLHLCGFEDHDAASRRRMRRRERFHLHALGIRINEKRPDP